MIKLRQVTTSLGTYTDVWVDGKYTRFPFAIVSEAEARQLIATYRRRDAASQESRS